MFLKYMRDRLVDLAQIILLGYAMVYGLAFGFIVLERAVAAQPVLSGVAVLVLCAVCFLVALKQR